MNFPPSLPSETSKVDIYWVSDKDKKFVCFTSPKEKWNLI